MFVDHIAFLTSDLQRHSDALPDFCHKHSIETFPSEGTQEQYVELTQHSPKLLLLQAIAAGPYLRSLQKRGPGLHHLGVKTPSLKALIPSLTQAGLLMHVISIQTLDQGIAWLCRPGLPFLLELSESPPESEFDILELGMPRGCSVPDAVKDMFTNLRVYSADSDVLEFKSGNRQFQLPLL